MPQNCRGTEEVSIVEIEALHIRKGHTCCANMTSDDARTARKLRLMVKSSTRRLREACSARRSSTSMHLLVSVGSRVN